LAARSADRPKLGEGRCPTLCAGFARRRCHASAAGAVREVVAERCEGVTFGAQPSASMTAGWISAA
jgi:hypothetical protein